MSEKRIIKLSRTTDDQLMKLANSLGVKVDQIDFKQHLNRNADYAIINMGNPQIGGTHWLAVSNKHKAYFDPLGLPRPRVIPKDYSYREVEIQSPRFGHCGQYCVLWLYYLQHNQLDKFFKLFNDQSP
ncbi:putative peptidase C5, adenain, papain-like cysteine peptidase superfamily [Plasmopara halstedii]